MSYKENSNEDGKNWRSGGNGGSAEPHKETKITNKHCGWGCGFYNSDLKKPKVKKLQHEGGGWYGVPGHRDAGKNPGDEKIVVRKSGIHPCVYRGGD